MKKLLLTLICSILVVRIFWWTHYDSQHSYQIAEKEIESWLQGKTVVSTTQSSIAGTNYLTIIAEIE